MYLQGSRLLPAYLATMPLTSSRTLPILAIVALCSLVTALVLRPASFPVGVAQFAPIAAAPVEMKRGPMPGRTYALDALLIDDAQFPITGATIGIVKSTTATVAVVGWAIDSHSMKPGEALLVGIDRGAMDRATTYGVPRPDVAAAIKDPDALNSGFRANLQLAPIAPGVHHIHFAILAADGSKTDLPTDISVLLQK